MAKTNMSLIRNANGYVLFELKCGLKLKERAKWE